MPLLSDFFRMRPKTKPSEFKPTCNDCQSYRNLIRDAKITGNVLFLNALMHDFNLHVEKEHTHAHHS